MTSFNRRNFIKTASIAAAGSAALLNGCSSEKSGEAPAVQSAKKVEWKLVTSWPPNFPIFHELLVKLSDWVKEMSNGNFTIQVYGGGELVPPLEAFDAVSQGVAEIGHSAAYYWAGKAPAAQLFTGVPFGMNTQQTNAWLYYGGGIDLWKEVYEPFNLIPFPSGNTGAQMGGWFNKKINSVSDFRGLKIRIPGLGGKVLSKAGAATILSPASELYTNLERGVLDALEWVGPYHDYVMGFHQVARYYYYPAWHEPTGCCDLFVNKSAFNKLPSGYQSMIEIAARALNITMISLFEERNSEYLYKLKQEGKVEFIKFPDEVISGLKKHSDEVLNELINSDRLSKKVFESYMAFQKKINPWTDMIERNYLL